MINITTHKLLGLVKSNPYTFRISFKDSDVFILKDLNPIDPSVYDSNGQWTATIIEIISTSPPKEKLLKAGVGLDFKEDDVQEIIDIATGQLIYIK